jgi:hypothetical protein
MKKLLQALVCGLAAVSFSAIAADDKKSTELDTKAGAGASADVKADKKVKGKAAKPTRDARAGAGGSAGTKAENEADVTMEKGKKTEAAPAPAPTPTPTK